MEQKGVITTKIRQMLDEQGYAYDTSEDGNIFVLGFNLQASLSSVRTLITETNLGFSIVAVAPIKGDPDNQKQMQALAELASRINYSIRLFVFSLDFSDGEIRCELNYPCEEGFVPSSDLIHNMLALMITTWNRFASSFLSVIFGGKSPEEAFNDVASKE